MSDQTSPLQNVGTQERLISAIIGTLVLSSAFRHRSALGVIGAGALFYRAFSGNCKCYEALGINPDGVKPE